MSLEEGAATIPYKTAIIINPWAGRGRSLRVWRRIEPLLQAAGQSYRVYHTRCKGDGGSLAEQARADGAELIVGMGGDGTLHEIVNGIDLKKNILGIIPGGTGNGFRRTLKIPANCRKALLGLSTWSPRKVDLGMINGTYFLNCVGFGFDAAVAKLASVDNRVLRGYPAYVSAFLYKLAAFGSFPAAVNCDSQTIEEEQTLLAVISNGRYYGGQLCIAPRARVDDGLLNLCLIKKAGYLSITALAVRAFFKNHLGHSAVRCTTGESLFIDASTEIPVQIDGEVRGSLPAKVEIMPGALTVLAPPVVD